MVILRLPPWIPRLKEAGMPYALNDDAQLLGLRTYPSSCVTVKKPHLALMFALNLPSSHSATGVMGLR
jgi:hypothetical protein